MIIAADRLKCQPWEFFGDTPIHRRLWYTLALVAHQAEYEARKMKADFDASWVRT